MRLQLALLALVALGMFPSATADLHEAEAPPLGPARTCYAPPPSLNSTAMAHEAAFERAKNTSSASGAAAAAAERRIESGDPDVAHLSADVADVYARADPVALALDAHAIAEEILWGDDKFAINTWIVDENLIPRLDADDPCVARRIAERVLDRVERAEQRVVTFVDTTGDRVVNRTSRALGEHVYPLLPDDVCQNELNDLCGPGGDDS